MLSSCKSITMINEVINRTVNYPDNISILDFEDALVEATKIATESSVGIVSKTGNVLFRTESFASGTVIKRVELSNNKYEYYVLTNRHVVLTDNGNEKELSIKFPNEETVSAQLCVYDNNKDIAIIKFESVRIINPAKINIDNLDVGRFVISVGNPYDINKYYETVTIGNISFVNRYIIEEDVNKNSVTNVYIQHTASLNSGNSGGGLYNIKGELIGVNCWKIVDESVESMNFSLPLNSFYNDYKEYFE